MSTYRRATQPPRLLSRLVQDLHTPIGILPAGTTVIILGAGLRFARICCDTGAHLTDRCHASKVPLDYLDPQPTMTRSDTQHDQT